MQNKYVFKGSVKLAYLILTHQSPEFLARLVNRLDSPNVHFFIHVNAMTDIQPFLRAVLPAENVHFTDVRSKVHWRGFSTTKAILQLMKEVVEHEQDFKYCILLSGADYPIKTRDYIQSFFENATLEYIQYARLQDYPSWQNSQMPRIQQYYFNDALPYDRFRKQPRLFRLLRRKGFRLLSRIVPRQFPTAIEPYSGATWFTLTGECVAYIIDYVHDNPQFLRYYKYTDAPDEMMFLTIVLNSHFAERTVNYKEYCRLTKIDDIDERWAEVERTFRPESFHLRYIDFSRGGGSPANLTEDHFPALEKSEALWARKFHPTTSAQLLDMIDTKLLHLQ